MGELQPTDNARQRPGVKRKGGHSLRIDMTPMVDLGFLLITFFIFTAQLGEPRAMNLNMPAAGPPSTLGESNALTVLLGSNDRIFYYRGKWEDAIVNKTILESSYHLTDGIGAVIREHQQYLDQHPVKVEGKEGLMLLIKPMEQSSYRNVVDVLDEVSINNVKQYAIMRMEEAEKIWASGSGF